MTAEPAVTVAEQAPASIRVESVTHTFPASGPSAEDVRALETVSFDIAPGSFVALVGPSGCGKTTLLNIMGGLEELQSGRVLVDGQAPRTGRDDVAYMFARPALMPWRGAMQNVEFGMEMRGLSRKERAETARAMLARVGLTGFENSYPGQLSQGMRQRVALARTFAVESHVLLMDEPFGALDAQTKLVLEDVLLELWEARAGATVVFVTHDLAEAVTLADRVVIMSARPGRIIADVPVNLARPRTALSLQSSTDYHEVLSHLWDKLRVAIDEGGER